MLFNHISKKMTDLFLLVTMILIFIAIFAEADIYVPAFPEMMTYLLTTEDKIQLIVSLNFAALSLAILICKPLSYAFGQRIIDVLEKCTLKDRIEMR
jgi:hypothetical protein